MWMEAIECDGRVGEKVIQSITCRYEKNEREKIRPLTDRDERVPELPLQKQQMVSPIHLIYELQQDTKQKTSTISSKINEDDGLSQLFRKTA